MAHRDDTKVVDSTVPFAGPPRAMDTAARYEAPRILRKRSVVDATLQALSGGCTPGQPGCGVGGH